MDRQRGTALAIAVVFSALLSVLGLMFLLAAEDEGRMARNEKRAEQALYAAEAAARCARGWFENPDPASGFLVPLPSQVNRSLRRVDPDGDGTTTLWTSAPAPWNVVYRQGTDDLFDRPWLGTPALSFEGSAAGPDLRIARDGSASERAFLASLDEALFAGFPSDRERARIARIDAFAPPAEAVAGQRIRLGLATIEVTVVLLRDTAAGEKEVASRTVRAVIGALPYPASSDPLAVRGDVDLRDGIEVHWGAVRAGGTILLPAADTAAVPSAWPRRDGFLELLPDADADGTDDDTDSDGTRDWDEWWLDPDDTLDDPWFSARAGGSLQPAPAATESDSQPWPFDPADAPTGPSGAWHPNTDRSNLVQAASPTHIPDLAYALWKAAAQEGGAGRSWFAWDAAVGAWRESGTGPPVGVDAATRARSGLFFFDTADGAAPLDATGDGTADNLAPGVVLGPGWWSSGVIWLGAASLRFEGLARAGRDRAIAMPGEPCADRDGNGACGPDEPFLRLAYPADPLAAGASFERIALLTPVPGVTRLSTGPTVLEPLAFEGVFVVAGDLEPGGDAIVRGGVVVGGSVRAGPTPPGGALTILADPGLATGASPAAESGAPRTLLIAWETENRASPLPAP